MSRTLLDISRVGSEAHWPAIATEVNGYLQNWMAAANAQVSEHELRIATGPDPDATDEDSCGWRIEATLSQRTPGGNPAELILYYLVTGTAVGILPGIGNQEPFLGGDNGWDWIFPTRSMSGASGGWTPPTPMLQYPFNAQVGWSLAAGAEYFVFAYSQHRISNRMAVPLLIARDQVSGHWILASTPPSSAAADGLRAVCWDKRSGQPSGSRSLIRPPATGGFIVGWPAELALSTSDWSTFSGSKNVPSYFHDSLILPPDFAVTNYNGIAQYYHKGFDGRDWLALGYHGLLLRVGEGGAEP